MVKNGKYLAKVKIRRYLDYICRDHLHLLCSNDIRALVRGGARGAVAPPSFWDLLNRISKIYLSVNPY